MFWYETHGDASRIYAQLTSQEVDQWRKPDLAKRKEAERYALIHALKRRKTEYVIKGPAELILAEGTVQELQQKHPDVTAESAA